MKRNFIKPNPVFVGILISLFYLSSSAQLPYDIVPQVMQAGKEDASIFLNEYMRPLGKAWGINLTGGWYNTAKTHETGGFNLSYAMHFAQIPNMDKKFDLINIGLQVIKPVDGNNIAPTIVNANETANVNIYIANNIPLLTDTLVMKGFDIPNGVRLPTFNIGFGIFRNTDIIGRIIPNSNVGDFGSINIWGIGIKHDFMQWLTMIEVPVDASIFFGYSRLKMTTGITYTPIANEINVTLPEKHEMNMKISALTANVIISKKVFFLTPYISAGIANSNFKMQLSGTYYYPQLISGQTVIEDDDNYRSIDPVIIKPENNIQSQFAAGLSFNFRVFYIHAQYTMQEYNMISAGFAISFR